MATGLLFLVLATSLVYASWRAARAAERLTALSGSSAAVVPGPDDTREVLDLAGERLAEGRRALREFRAWSWPVRVSAPLWAWAPGRGGDISQAGVLAAYAGHVLDAATALHSTAAAAAATRAGTPPAVLREAARAIETHSPGLSDARDHLDAAAGLHRQIDRDRLSPGVRAAAEQLHSLELALGPALGVIERAPPALRAAATTLDLAAADGAAVAPGALASELAAAEQALGEAAPLLDQLAVASEGLAGLVPIPAADAALFFHEGAIAADASAGLLAAAAQTLDAASNGLPAGPAAAGRLEAALRGLDVAGQTAARAFDNWRWPVTPPARVSALPASLSDLAGAARFSIDLLGYDGPRTHLVLGQDDDELRPSGGFIGTVWEATFDRGLLTGSRFLSSYEVDDRIPLERWRRSPAGFALAFGADVIPFRDQNWWADFPTSANALAATYLAGTGARPNTIVALNQGAVERLVDAVGGLRLEDGGGPVTGADVRRLLAEGLPVGPERLGRPGWDERRAAAVALATALVDHLTRGQPVDAPRLLSAVIRSGAEGDLLVAAGDPDMAAFVRDRGWDGGLPEVTGGDWYLVESNAYGPKISQDIDRAIEQIVQLRPDGSAHTTLVISHRNPASGTAACVQPAAPPASPCYWEYLRLYLSGDAAIARVPTLPLPPGAVASARLPSGSDTATVSNGERDHGSAATEFAGLAVVPPGERIQLKFEYVAPGAADRLPGGAWHYRASTRRQPGLPPLPYRLQVRLPPGACLLDAPAAATTGAGAVTFDTIQVPRLSLDLRYALNGQAGCESPPG